ncbi:DUF6069 family protein [Micromonospora parathelypteridis]|uniref:Fatty acid desaturase n=1 Tax=Micromonospora parathelypteridis TaxID=1839617 RepID=A0A840VXV9_9ACTN|nr:DUF6069 family protein [Micromonospora parathelypteridis]MBB5481595.1 fatty acid desaturase [Micromonospora parathelypteridis]GGO29109.1 hypothetical protein GCM10011576_55440 [Micromonospora parathelypteridis]
MSAAAVTTPATSSLRRRALGVVVAVVACLAIWSIGALAGVDYTVKSPGQPATDIGPGAIVVVALGAALLGWAALALLERFAARVARPVWISLAGVVTLLSFAPLAGTEATGGAKLALGATHVAVAVALIALLPARRR